MRRVVKNPESDKITKNLIYKNDSSNAELSAILFKDQLGFCAYTEQYLGRADARDIEHFNPHLKGTNQDNYNNWFLVKHQWNKEKSTKWDGFQPVLHPTDIDFENRIAYKDGDYFASSSSDLEANNLVCLIKLDDPILADERKRYISRKRKEIEMYNTTADIFFAILLNENIQGIQYIRAIKEEFNVDIIALINQNKKQAN